MGFVKRPTENADWLQEGCGQAVSFRFRMGVRSPATDGGR